jgi:hypothetical protein
MSAWRAQPFISVGPIVFEMTRADLQRALREEPQLVVKEPDAPLVEQYNAGGVQAYFDTSDHLEFVELSMPAQVSIVEIDVLNRDLASVLRDFRRAGLTVIDDGLGSLWCYERGFALYHGGKTTERMSSGEPAECVSVYSKGYAKRELANGYNPYKQF